MFVQGTTINDCSHFRDGEAKAQRNSIQFHTGLFVVVVNGSAKNKENECYFRRHNGRYQCAVMGRDVCCEGFWTWPLLVWGQHGIEGCNQLLPFGGKSPSRSTWMTEMVERPTLDFGSGHDLMVHGINPCLDSSLTVQTLLEILSLPLSLPPPPLSNINK